jgi:predicted acylesterase/phospholipase RssA
MKGVSYDGLVLAGGGCRCFWQMGFLEVLASETDFAPCEVSAVSAGSAMACAFFAGVADRVFAHFSQRAEANEANIYPKNLFGGGRVFPHEEIYRDTILECIDEAGLDRLHQGPRVRVLFARLPPWLGPRTGVGAGLLAYELEKILSPSLHPRLGAALGFREGIGEVLDCRSPEDLLDLILCSSCTPPFTPVFRRDGEAILDGGLLDNVPVGILSPERKNVLVLLSRRYDPDLLTGFPGRTYVQPSAEMPVSKWDYTSPEGLAAARDMGRRDAEAFIRTPG